MTHLKAWALRAYARLERWVARMELDPEDPVEAFALARLDGTVYTMEREES